MSLETCPSQGAQSLQELRLEVRNFLAAEVSCGSFAKGPGLWLRFDPDFSARLGERQWIGMTWPIEYGGRAQSALHRYVVTEELLASGAPLRAHWVADRQVGPSLLRYGSDHLKKTLLPTIAEGRCFFCIGMSEPNSGSDLASLRTRAEKVDGGWLINGRKTWTSNAHRVHYMNLMARTSTDRDNRRAGITQFVMDMKSPGISVRPIINMVGEHDFNEVELSNVFIPEEFTVGQIGNGWSQLSSELAYERSGPERWLGSHGLLSMAIDKIGPRPDRLEATEVGSVVADLYTLHVMSMGTASRLEKGEIPSVEASVTKDLGTHFEQGLPSIIEKIVNVDQLNEEDSFTEILRYAQRNAPTLTIKGGAREILRSIIAKDLGVK